MTHNKAFTTNLSLDSIPNNIQEALAIPKLKEVVSKEMKGDLGSGRLAFCKKKTSGMQIGFLYQIKSRWLHKRAQGQVSGKRIHLDPWY